MRICFTVTEILGAHRNGGIGTATSHLAIFIANAGHHVTLLNCSDSRLSDDSPWRHLYRRYGIEVVNVPFQGLAIEPWMSRASVAAYDYLRIRTFDVIVFQDWLGLAYSSAVAKRCGVAFSETLLVVNTHGSKQWVNEVAGLKPDGRSSITQQFIERRAIELADAVVSPSTYMLDWMRRAGWRLPDNSVMLQNYLRGWRLAGMEYRHRPEDAHPENHLVYFGRLEHRKGIYLFLEALDLPPLRHRHFRLTFLGREADANPDAVRVWLEKHRSDLLPQVQFLVDKTAEEARDYLVDSAGLAVIPSLSDNSPCVIWEAIENGIPFVSTVNGGIPELVPDHEHARMLVRPDAGELSRALSAALEGGRWALPGHRLDPEAVGRSWLAWLGDSASRRSRTSVRVDPRRAHVVLLHDGPDANLTTALQDLLLQTVPTFDLTVVSPDDRPSRPMPMTDRGLSPVWLRWRGSLKQGLSAALDGHDAQPVVIVRSDIRITPNAVEDLLRGLQTFPDCAVTGQTVLTDTDVIVMHAALSVPQPARVAPPGGPVAVGAVENVFGDFPLGLPPGAISGAPGVLSGIETSWIPEDATSAWTILAAWAVAGRPGISVPSVLSVRNRPPSSFASWQADVKVRNEVQSVYMAAIPDDLRLVVAASFP